ncbi:MAG: DUF2812 domain-containing protein, partial [Spirochaetales bacterium]|nr:DUF2812 domain-containing protein [Spirochaetales bacterium]
MKKIVRKAYINYEKEEKWLNEMCSKGYGLVGYSWCKYTFNDCEPNEYIYRLEMLEHLPSSPEGQKYLEFLKDTGIEHVATYIKWVFLRKKSSDGQFNLFTDIESKVKHHMRIA